MMRAQVKFFLLSIMLNGQFPSDILSAYIPYLQFIESVV